ncbi:Vesicular acetylcholine transporter like protein [Argiope bruennichi]|uniref:Vesicular acetylcholine transporter like protein n=2 Tax=Argiope bruennichi TaxID=94029 RepID=A0A8T0EQ92_ARGBR|nr:Vesicular acetylcholine transporter like protein [Argiope bruennichi]
MDAAQVWRRVNDKLEHPESQRKMVLVIVCVALLLDNMLYMVIVPIIPDYLRYIGAWKTHTEQGEMVWDNSSAPVGSNDSYWRRGKSRIVYEGEDSAVGMLFASKAIVQLFVNPFSGTVIDKIGYDTPMMIGLTIMFISTAMFACGQSYGILFFARSLQGVGSAFADTGGLAMIADRFTEDEARSKAIGIAQAFISFGSLVAPPFGGFLYEFAGKEVPFIVLSMISLMDGFALLFVMRPVKEAMKEQGIERPKGTPIYRLFIDKYIFVCAGTLVMANVSLAFLEPTIALWMKNTMENIDESQMGIIWLPAFIPHVFGVYTTVKLCKKYPKYQWLLAATGLALEGISSIFVPFSTSYWVLMIPLSGICFGIAQVDTSLLPMLGHLVDTRYVSVYGSIYAIADISYSLAYAIGPIIAGGIVDSLGFTGLNMIIAITNLAYVPAILMLRHVYDYDTFENEQIVLDEVPTAQYKTFTMDNGNAVSLNTNVAESGNLEPDLFQSQQQQQQQQQLFQADPRSSQQPVHDTNPFRQPQPMTNSSANNLQGQQFQNQQATQKKQKGNRGYRSSTDMEKMINSSDED